MKQKENPTVTMLSSQRCSEDQDLLERSTKKSKQGAGGSDAAAMNVVEESDAGVGDDVPGLGLCEMVSDSPLEAPVQVTTMGSEGIAVEEVHETPLVEEASLSSEGQSTNPLMGGKDRQPRSYLDTVVGSGSGTTPFLIANLRDDEVGDGMEEEDPSVEDDDPTCPNIRLSAKEKEHIREPWRQMLIVKVMGRMVGYVYLLRRLQAMWRPKSRIELIALDNDYFLVKFGMREDLEFAKYEGHG